MYAAAVDSRKGEAARIVVASSEAWLVEQRKFRELAASVRALRMTVEHQESRSANISKAIRGSVKAVPRLPSRSGDVSHKLSEPVVRGSADTRTMSPEM